MGYDADLLKMEFNEDRIRSAAAEELDLSVTVANTRERQEALAKKDTNVRIEFHTRRDAALIIILDRLDHESDGIVAGLTNKELGVLLRLRWKGVTVSKMGNMVSKRALYHQFVGDRGEDDLCVLARWTFWGVGFRLHL
jgi:hypothetical protein